MNNSVVVIREECHGFIGLAKDMKSAFQFLLKDNWITENTEFFINYGQVDEEYLRMEEIRIKYGLNTLLETLLFVYDIEGYEFFEGSFYFDDEDVYVYEYEERK